MHKSLLDVVANAELLDELTVLIDVVLLDVGEETTTLTNQHKQTTAGVEVLLVGLHVLGQLLDALGQDGDLNLGVAGVLGVLAELGGELRLALLGNRHDFTFLVAAAGCAPHGLDSPSTGKPPVERISKWRVPTGRYVTTDQQHNAAIAQVDHVMDGLNVISLQQCVQEGTAIDICSGIELNFRAIQAIPEVLMGSLTFGTRAGIGRKPLHHIADGVPAVLGKLGLEMRAQAEGLAQERLQVSPIPQSLAGRGQLELEGETDSAHKAVERPGTLVAREAPALVERLERHVRDLPAQELAGIDSEHRLAARLVEHAHDIHLVGIPRDGAEKALASAQARRKPEVAAQGNGALDDVRPFRIAGEAPHLILEHLDTERRMAT